MDWRTAFRRRVHPPLDRLLRRLGKYAAYRLHEAEYVGTVDEPVDGVGETLVELGYEPSACWKTALKYHWDDGSPDHGSFRRIDRERPTRQWHVHVWPDPEDGSRTVVASHYEIRPDLTRPSLDLDRVKRHYRPDYGETYLRGEACPDVEAWAGPAP